jgi:Gpi18-like mannosyltransferase
VEAAATGFQAREATVASFSIRFKPIFPLMLGGLVVRLLLALLPGFGIDIGTFEAWSRQLAQDGPWNFYSSDFFTDYAPGYMYVLMFIGKIDQSVHFTNDQYEYVLKLPSIAADMASAYLLYLLLERQRMGVRLGAVAIYVAFPAALLIGPVWGQVDSLLAFFLLLTVYFVARDRPVAGAVAYTIGFLTKPQAVAALPFIAFWVLRQHPSQVREPVPRVWLECVGAALVTFLVLITPFFTDHPWGIIGQLYDATNVENYRVNSFWAYNFWNVFGIFESGFRCDVPVSQCAAGAHPTEIFGLYTRYWGLLLTGVSLVAIIGTLWRARGTGHLALGVALSVLAFYMFMTRMHERYVFAAFLPLLAACALIHSRALWAGFVSLAVIHVLNLYHVYEYYYPDSLHVQRLYHFLEESDLQGTGLETLQIFSILMVASFLAVLATAYALGRRKIRAKAA